MKPLAISVGEPSGIGPEVTIKALLEREDLDVLVFADPALMNHTAERLGSELRFGPEGIPCEGPATLAAVTPGYLDAANARYVLDQLAAATAACVDKRCAALVTAPLHKGIINDAGIPFTGHTEFLAEKTGAEHVVMMLAAGGLRVALATTHLPLRKVPDAITATRLERTLRIIHQDLVDRFGIPVPRIAVCGLNPHAGEGGHLGLEEIEIIEPALDRLRSAGMRLTGPLPADTAFLSSVAEGFDAILAMYHDQGLPVLKRAGFGAAVNITLGLPIVRTSVDHGTALDIAGRGIADPGSMLAAIDVAMELVSRA